MEHSSFSRLIPPDSAQAVADSKTKGDYLLCLARSAHLGPRSMAHIIKTSTTHLSSQQLNLCKITSVTVAPSLKVHEDPHEKSVRAKTSRIVKVIASDIC